MNFNKEPAGAEINSAETGGELSPEAQAEKDAQIMEGLKARRAAEAAVEAAVVETANSQRDASITETRKQLDESYDWDNTNQRRAGMN